MRRKARSGSLESNDIMLLLEEEDGADIRITLTSTVYDLFGEDIKKTLRETAEAEGISGIHIIADDKGALPCTIKARLLTAINRLQG